MLRTSLIVNDKTTKEELMDFVKERVSNPLVVKNEEGKKVIVFDFHNAPPRIPSLAKLPAGIYLIPSGSAVVWEQMRRCLPEFFGTLPVLIYSINSKEYKIQNMTNEQDDDIIQLKYELKVIAEQKLEEEKDD